MSACAVDVQIYNINYLRNISGALAVPYPPVQKRVPASKRSRAPKFQFSFIVDPGQGSRKTSPHEWRKCVWLRATSCLRLNPFNRRRLKTVFGRFDSVNFHQIVRRNDAFLRGPLSIALFLLELLELEPRKRLYSYEIRAHTPASKLSEPLISLRPRPNVFD